MDVVVPGERLGPQPSIDEMEEDFEITNPTLRVERNNRNPIGFIFTIEDGEDTFHVRITSESMKLILKSVIDEL